MFYESNARPLINKANIRYILTKRKEPFLGFERVYKHKDITIWENLENRGLVSIRKNKNELVSEKLSFDYIKNSIVVKMDNIRAEDGSEVYFSENYFSGWKAYSDNKEINVYEDYNFGKFVKIKNPVDELVLIYQPFWFYFGASISILTLLLMVIIIFSNELISYKENKI